MPRNLINFLVNKPWGDEYVICKTRNSLTTFLTINYNHKTSLHCHPTKKTGFVVLKGKVEVQLGFYDKVILSGPAKLMIRPGLFHSTKAISKKGAFVLELESPIDKDDLVRFRDDYGRQDTPYEDKSKMSKISPDKLIFHVPKKFGIKKYNFQDIKITIEKQYNINKLINRSKNTIFAIMDGGLSDKKNRLVLCPGDIVRLDTIKKLTEVFNIKKQITFMTIHK